MKVEIDLEALRPLILATVRETLAQAARELPPAVNGNGNSHGDRGAGERLAYPEREAAGLIGLAAHQLRDARLRGELKCSGRGPRGVAMYTRADLLAYLGRSA